MIDGKEKWPQQDNITNIVKIKKKYYYYSTELYLYRSDQHDSYLRVSGPPVHPQSCASCLWVHQRHQFNLSQSPKWPLIPTSLGTEATLVHLLQSNNAEVPWWQPCTAVNQIFIGSNYTTRRSLTVSTWLRVQWTLFPTSLGVWI